MKLVPLVNVARARARAHVCVCVCVCARARSRTCVWYTRERNKHTSRSKRKPLSISSILSNSQLSPLRQGLFSHCCESSVFRLADSKLSGSTCLCSLKLELPHDYFWLSHMGAGESNHAEGRGETTPTVDLRAGTKSMPIHQAIYLAP